VPGGPSLQYVSHGTYPVHSSSALTSAVEGPTSHHHLDVSTSGRHGGGCSDRDSGTDVRRCGGRIAAVRHATREASWAATWLSGTLELRRLEVLLRTRYAELLEINWWMRVSL
jgi:hypothetical protein